MRVAIYRNSVLASICSIGGGVMIASGVTCCFSGIIPVGVVLILCGLGMLVLAEGISERKRCKAYFRKLKEAGFEDQIRRSRDVAFSVYNNLPGKQTLNYIRSLNSAAAADIQAALDAQKAQKKNK